jgi:hypothetical protein
LIDSKVLEQLIRVQKDAGCSRPCGRIYQDCAAGQGDKGGVILCGFLASHGDPLRAFQFAEYLLDTGGLCRVS